MLSSRIESFVSCTGVGDQQNANGKVELEVHANAPNDGSIT